MGTGFSFQDGTPFPAGREFFDWIIEVFTAGRDVAEAQSELNLLDRAQSEQTNSQHREIKLIHQLTESFMKVTESTQEHSNELPLAFQLASKVARFVQENAAMTIDDHHQNQSKQNAERQRRRHQQEQIIQRAMTKLLLTNVAPIGAPQSFALTSTGFTARCKIAETIRVDYALQCDLDVFSKPKFFLDELHFPPQINGQFIPQGIENWLITQALITPNGCDLKLTKEQNSTEMVVLTILKAGGNVNARLKVGPQTVQFEDSDSMLLRLQQNLYAALVSRLSCRNQVLNARVKDHDIYSTEGIELFFDAIIDTIAPLAEDVSRRSIDPSIWTIVGDGMEYRLRTPALIESLPPVYGPLRQAFERIPLHSKRDSIPFSETTAMTDFSRLSSRDPDTLPN